ncbi:trypsin-like peptidase domain-containing protein [Parvularcula sp. LCG005]|uniref:trypsin-like peptidase domain-containing protein n=1 Tax=Parvularcula sp. LCG005 TaxID=3078805 RepID=UPI002943A2A9|nr:trypsin-like peptidase domain-containing protein [Parvularcula sp. LCG005]WOI52543.1 trypsin-like peptidase domain-containing protein [Parvularcula sp. LCG005]
MIDTLLLTTVRVSTYIGDTALSTATCFFFERDGRLFLVTSNHVVFDEPSGHKPDRLVIDLHTDISNIAQATNFSIPLYRNGKSIWRGAKDSGGAIDVAVVEIERSKLPAGTVIEAFTLASLVPNDDDVEIGATLLTVGYPMGFHDELHHLPVVRQAALSSSFGLRFQGMGYFLVDARTHRGISGAPVVMRVPQDSNMPDRLPWKLLGIHSARLESPTRDPNLDDLLGLNAVWYADVLTTLTEN